MTKQKKALQVQVGGNHYKKYKIQPIEFIHANKIPFIEGNIIKYICRWRDKNGVKDLEKGRALYKTFKRIRRIMRRGFSSPLHCSKKKIFCQH